MKPIIFAKDCNYKEQFFLCGKELKKFKKEDLSDIWKLNEKGIIQPLSLEDFKEIEEKFDKKKEKI